MKPVIGNQYTLDQHGPYICTEIYKNNWGFEIFYFQNSKFENPLSLTQKEFNRIN